MSRQETETDYKIAKYLVISLAALFGVLMLHKLALGYWSDKRFWKPVLVTIGFCYLIDFSLKILRFLNIITDEIYQSLYDVFNYTLAAFVYPVWLTEVYIYSKKTPKQFVETYIHGKKIWF